MDLLTAMGAPELTARELIAHPGFAEAVALYLTPPKRESLTSWGLLNDYLLNASRGAGTESFRCLFLDKKNQLIADEVMGRGTVDHAPVYPREVAKRALALDASAVILTHNHPSGDPKPSNADVDMTRQIIEALRALRIAVHDHVITGGGTCASLIGLGLM